MFFESRIKHAHERGRRQPGAMRDPGHRPGPSWRLSLAVMVVGALLVVPLVVRAVQSFGSTFTEDVHGAPARVSRDLSPGHYVVFERTGSRQSVGPVTAGNDRGVTLSPGQVQVIGPDGASTRRPVGYDRSDETVTRGNAVYTGAVVFDVERGGRYEIVVAAEGTSFFVTRSLGDSAKRLGGVFLVALGGGLVFLAGGTLLLVGLVRRRGASVPVPVAMPGGPPPPGWYPDPGGAGRRYWDGTRWTEHAAP
jgi:hypothetical protein